MKLCPQCEKENPSSTNCCMYCETALVSEEQLSEEVKMLNSASIYQKIIILIVVLAMVVWLYLEYSIIQKFICLSR